MAVHVVTIAIEATIVAEAASREEVLAAVRRVRSADLWPAFNEAAAMRGEPAKGLLSDVKVRLIGRPA
jgi:hypothetical protein